MESSTQLPNPPTATTEGDCTLTAVLNDRGYNNRPPIHRLPLEPLSIIVQKVHSRKSYRMLFAIRFVCGLWMKFIDSSPEFWCSISLKHKPNLLMMLLRNSKSRPLSVHYSPDRISVEDPEEQITDFFQLVAPSIGRWKTLEYCSYSSAFDERIISLPLRNLETLIVNLRGTRTLVHYLGSLDAPKLHRINFNSFTLDWRTIPNLRVVELSGLDSGLLVNNLHLLFKASPSLESLDINADLFSSTNRNRNDLSRTPTLLPKLQRLIIWQLQSAPCARLLDLIHCPNLRDFFAIPEFDSSSEGLAPVLESMGGFIGGPRQPGRDDFTKLLIGESASGFMINLGFRKVLLLKNDTWDEQNRQQDCQDGLSAALRKFDGRTIKGISKIILHGVMRHQHMTELCLILHRYCPNVTKLQVELSSLQGGSNGYPVLEWLGSPLPLEDGGGWLFPKLTALRVIASEGSNCDGILRIVEGRRTGEAQAIRNLEIRKGKVGRGTVQKLKTHLEDLGMVGTEVF